MADSKYRYNWPDQDTMDNKKSEIKILCLKWIEDRNSWFAGEYIKVYEKNKADFRYEPSGRGLIMQKREDPKFLYIGQISKER